MRWLNASRWQPNSIASGPLGALVIAMCQDVPRARMCPNVPTRLNMQNEPTAGFEARKPWPGHRMRELVRLLCNDGGEARSITEAPAQNKPTAHDHEPRKTKPPRAIMRRA